MFEDALSGPYLVCFYIALRGESTQPRLSQGYVVGGVDKVRYK